MGALRTLIVALAALALGAAGFWLWSSGGDEVSAQSMVASFQRHNELTVFSAQVVAVPTTKRDGMFDMLDRVQTSIIPAKVRYTVDLSRLTERDVAWDAAGKTLTITAPPVVLQPAELDPVAKRVFRTGPPAAATTWDTFDRSNMIKAREEAGRLARAPDLMRMAEASARDALTRNAELFLRGAGIEEAKVRVRFANEGRSGEQMDRSTPLNEALGTR
ncbi:DUF4230 domain-containing protein [Sphingomonas sp. ID1715]|uniref:DUF4230 domain-containing protein n=1 Tax=Sphingomonas sp. ID1715 TaxID=1656898 RepID=UPI0014894F0A|nr:DUF4230 domain-containing protein [Sphingomonas sp. ID1715]NNM75728.1 DUF4230 domain-containing protein [Sphingomonas sp. ID1715]